MGADASVFQPQKIAFPHLIVPDWPAPQPADDLSSYCRRLADEINPGGPCFVGGASFGGAIALEMTRHLDTIACFLIGSVRGPHEMPWRIRAFRSFGPAIGLLPISMLQRSADSSRAAASRTGAKHLAGVMSQFSQADADVLRWSARQILRWDERYDDGVVRHIHGDRDRVFPVGNVHPDEIVSGGGHVISMTHGARVNEFLRKHIDELTSKHRAGGQYR